MIYAHEVPTMKDTDQEDRERVFQETIDQLAHVVPVTGMSASAHQAMAALYELQMQAHTNIEALHAHRMPLEDVRRIKALENRLMAILNSDHALAFIKDIAAWMGDADITQAQLKIKQEHITVQRQMEASLIIGAAVSALSAMGNAMSAGVYSVFYSAVLVAHFFCTYTLFIDAN